MIIYLASPYSIGDQAQNVHDAILAADKLVELGHIPIIPVLSHFWHLVSPKPNTFWLKYDLTLLSLCDCLLRLEGFSAGADAEVRYAEEQGITVYYSIDDIPKEGL